MGAHANLQSSSNSGQDSKKPMAFRIWYIEIHINQSIESMHANKPTETNLNPVKLWKPFQTFPG